MTIRHIVLAACAIAAIAGDQATLDESLAGSAERFGSGKKTVDLSRV